LAEFQKYYFHNFLVAIFANSSEMRSRKKVFLEALLPDPYTGGVARFFLNLEKNTLSEGAIVHLAKSTPITNI